MTFSWGSILGTNGLEESQNQEHDLTALDKAFLIASVPKSATAPKTWDSIYKAMCWSLNALWSGTWPEHDQNGKKVAGPLAKLAGQSLVPNRKVRFIMWNYLGDLDYFANNLKFRHWNTHAFCPLCNGSRSSPTNFIYDFSAQPGWELYTLEQHTANPASRHPLLNDVAGCTAAYRILFDGLHTIDLGYVAGCVAAHCVAWSIVVVLGKTSLQILSLLKSTWMVFVH